MNRLLLAVVLATAAVSAAAADVGVSLSLGQPGFYGRIDLGDYPAPRLVYRQPAYYGRVPVGRPPLYLHVPPGHAKNWRKHCHAYGACGERVYFVDNGWYEREYVPLYRERQRQRHDRDDHRDDHRGNDRNDHRGNDHDDRGRGR